MTASLALKNHNLNALGVWNRKIHNENKQKGFVIVLIFHDV